MTSKLFLFVIGLVWLEICSAERIFSAFATPSNAVYKPGSHQTQCTDRKCFVPLRIPNARRHLQQHISTVRMGPPEKIEYSTGRVVYNQEVARASYLLRIESNDSFEEYLPGHVLALAIEDPAKPGGELIHPYTITRSNKDRKTFDIVYR
jgi:hypothetical protein